MCNPSHWDNLLNGPTKKGFTHMKPIILSTSLALLILLASCTPALSPTESQQANLANPASMATPMVATSDMTMASSRRMPRC